MPARVLVCEPTSRWTAALERTFANELDVAWRPHTHDLLEDAAARPELILLVVAQQEAALSLIPQIAAVAPATTIMCLVDGNDPGWEWLARELGVSVVLPDIASNDRVMEAVSKALASTSATSWRQ